MDIPERFIRKRMPQFYSLGYWESHFLGSKDQTDMLQVFDVVRDAEYFRSGYGVLCRLPANSNGEHPDMLEYIDSTWFTAHAQLQQVAHGWDAERPILIGSHSFDAIEGAF